MNMCNYTYYHDTGVVTVDLSDKKVRKTIGRNCACFNLRRAARLVTQRFDLAFRESGLTANQFSILMASYNQEGILITRLARVLGMERTTLSRNLSLLEGRQLLSVTTGGDRRERRVAVTEKGTTLLGRTLPLWEKAQDDVVGSIGREEWAGLLSGLHRVVKGL